MKLGIAVFSGLLASVSCGSGTTMEPLGSSIIVGDFGGNQVTLHATVRDVTIQFSCAEVSVASPLVTDSDGRFTATGGRRRTGGAVLINGEQPVPVRLVGQVFATRGGTINMIVSDIPEEPGAPITWADTLSLERNKATTIFLCP